MAFFNTAFISIHASLREATKQIWHKRPGGSHFNSRLSARGYKVTCWFWRISRNFNSRLSTRGYMQTAKTSCVWRIFQFTPLYERLLMDIVHIVDACLFQFTPLYERLHAAGTKVAEKSKFQFTPLYERLLMLIICTWERCTISIHASLREATVISTANVGASIFQFTPLYERLRKAFPRISQMILFQFTPLCERLRTGELIIWWMIWHFNSRLSARGYWHEGCNGTHVYISIHASLREATY